MGKRLFPPVSAGVSRFSSFCSPQALLHLAFFQRRRGSEKRVPVRHGVCNIPKSRSRCRGTRLRATPLTRQSVTHVFKCILICLVSSILPGGIDALPKVARAHGVKLFFKWNLSVCYRAIAAWALFYFESHPKRNNVHCRGPKSLLKQCSLVACVGVKSGSQFRLFS